jgi:hemerythrin-like domain-containing protein
MVAVIDVLREEHANLARLLDLLEQQMADPQKADFGLVKSILDYCLTYPDQFHHPKEDMVYQALAHYEHEMSPSIEDLEAEHEEIGILTRETAAALDKAMADGAADKAYLVDMVRSFVEFYRRHIAKEEREFFPEALKILDAATWDDIASRVTDPADPLFNEKAAEHFLALRKRIAG